MMVFVCWAVLLVINFVLSSSFDIVCHVNTTVETNSKACYVSNLVNLRTRPGPDPSQRRASRPLLSRCHSKFSQRLQNAFLKPRLAGCVRGNLSSDGDSPDSDASESTTGHRDGPTVTVNLNLSRANRDDGPA
jgi:hypothetical protein